MEARCASPQFFRKGFAKKNTAEHAPGSAFGEAAPFLFFLYGVKRPALSRGAGAALAPAQRSEGPEEWDGGGEEDGFEPGVGGQRKGVKEGAAVGDDDPLKGGS